MSWKRLESATVDPFLAEGLEARVADPLWMLARQFQAGEFRGDDAANPLLIRVEAQSVRLLRLVVPDGTSIDLNGTDAPLEPLVEREPIRDGPSAPRVAAELGRLLVRSLQRVGAPRSLLAELRSRFPVTLPPDDGLDPGGRRRLEVLVRTGIDGVRLETDLTDDPSLVAVMLDSLAFDDEMKRVLTAAITAWHQSALGSFSEPGPVRTWQPQRMEYTFELEAAGFDGEEIRLTTADGYVGGRLDWFAFDRATSKGAKGQPGKALVHRVEVLPAPLRFRGMPAARFWEFEEGDVYLGGIEAAPEDLARVAVAGYGVVYGDDWLMAPIRIPVGTLTEITRVTVLDDFGRVSTVPAAAAVDGGGDDRAFKFFELSGDANPRNGRAPLLFLPPTVEATEAGRPLEDVRFLRDEMANVAWAVEHRIESPAGRPVDVAARRGSMTEHRTGRGADDVWRLVLSTPVPDNWVPLVPVRLTEESGSGATDGTIMFQRGRMPTTADPRSTRGALGRILVPRQRLLLHEEEIPRAGIRVVRRFQSARDPGGRLHTWVGRRKGPGRGEGSSGLDFDVLER